MIVIYIRLMIMSNDKDDDDDDADDDRYNTHIDDESKVLMIRKIFRGERHK